MLVATNTTVDENTLASVDVEFVFYWCHEPDIDSDTGDLQAPLTVAPFLREHVEYILFRMGRPPAGSFAQRDRYGNDL